MKQIRDALELLTAQHEELDQLCARVARSRDERELGVLADKLAQHLAIEQEQLYPRIQTCFAPEVMTELFEEHAAIKQVLANIIWLGVDDELFPDLFAQLSGLLLGHSAWQEDTLFTTAAEQLSMDQLSLAAAA